MKKTLKFIDFSDKMQTNERGEALPTFHLPCISQLYSMQTHGAAVPPLSTPLKSICDERSATRTTV